MERKIELGRWKLMQSLLNTVWMHRLYGEHSAIDDDEAIAALNDLLEELYELRSQLNAATGVTD